jgi:hypothetical protein
MNNFRAFLLKFINQFLMIFLLNIRLGDLIVIIYIPVDKSFNETFSF